MVLAVVLPVMLLLLAGLSVRALRRQRRRRWAELEGGFEGKSRDSVPNPTNGDDVYSAIDEDIPGPAQSLYAAMDYGEVGEITSVGAPLEAHSAVEDDEGLYEAPARMLPSPPNGKSFAICHHSTPAHRR